MELGAVKPMPWKNNLFTLLGIALIASAAASLNHLLDRQRDALMRRTQSRPLPQNKISTQHVRSLAIITIFLGSLLLYFFSNSLTLLLSLLSLFGYSIFYTLYLKRVTVQNIVIGGLAGASPPLLGWTAVTGQIQPGSLLLTLILFTWTPPHFWALALARYQDYVKSEWPILPVRYGIPLTKQHILLYVLLLSTVTLLPFSIGMSGFFYLIIALILNSGFILKATQLIKQKNHQLAIKVFHYSNFYLLMLFVGLLIDHSLTRSTGYVRFFC